jgi:hypothetical protein
MPCEKYQAALIELAACRAEAGGDLRAHLDVCISCRAALVAEGLLFDAIDVGLRRSANAELPAALLATVNARLVTEAVTRRKWLPAWELACAIAVVCLAVVMGFSLRGRRASPAAGDSGGSAFRSEQKKLVTEPVPRPAEALGNPPGSRQRQFQRVADRHTKSRGPLVLVPPDEREAFARFIADLNGRQDVALALATPLTELRDVPDESLDVPDLEIAALTVRLLEEREER